MTAETLTSPGYRPSTLAVAGGRRNWLTAATRGRTTDAPWVRPTLIGLLAATALLYLWGLGASGYANSFYSAAAQAGSQSWKALFFGSSDASNSITVDKPPVAIWVMAVAIRLFGLNSWSVLVPQALEGVAAVGFLYLTVKRVHGPVAGLIAGAAMALTPVAALMFRFNNPDAMLVLLMTVAAYCVVRALDTASTKWLVFAGALIGFGFLTKMLQAMLVVPAFALAYLIAAPNPVRRRVLQLLAAGAAMVAGAGWWIAIVSLIPAADRPYIGGSQHNSILELTFGYNGFGRLTGNETGSVGGGGTGTGMWGSTGWTRLFGSQMGNEIAFLLPTSMAMIGVGLWYTRRAGRTDRARASVILWGSWLLITWLTFSFASGIIHPYYTVALAPAVGALVGIGSAMLWQRRDIFSANLVLALIVAGTVVWNFEVLNRNDSWLPWVRYSILIGGIAAALLLLVISRLARAVGTVIASVALVSALGGSAAYAVATAANSHTGSIPSAGPASASSGGFGRGLGAGGLGGGARFGGGTRPNFTLPANGAPTTGTGVPSTGTPNAAQLPTGAFGGAGGLLNASTPPAAVVSALQTDAAKYTWVAAAVGSNTAAGYQLGSQQPVMAIGGFNGTDPSPTLAQFQSYVTQGKIHYFIAGGGFGGGRSSNGTSGSITTWVSSHYRAVTIGGVSMYDLTQPTS